MRYVAYLPGKPMHPLVRALAVVAGVGIFALLLVFGAMILLGLAAAGLIAYAVQRWRSRHAAPATGARRHAADDPLEGEFVVIEQRSESTHS